jgi:glycosyltransferase involved in cell wall biosynthesis
MTPIVAQPTSTDGFPLVSVILAIRNEAKYIQQVLQCLFAQTYPKDRMEILIADGASEDDTVNLIEQATAPFRQKEPKTRVMILENPKKIVPCGLNLCLEHAKGDIVVRVDGHTLIANDYVEACVSVLRESGAQVVGGPIDTVGEGFWPQVIAVAASSPFGVGNSTFRTSQKSQEVDTVPFGTFWRHTLDVLGGFDETYVRHQDYELNDRIRRSGGRVYLSHRIRSRYYSRASLGSTRSQFWQYGQWKGIFLKNKPRSLKIRHFPPPLLVLAEGAGVGLLLMGIWQPLTVLIGLYSLFLTLAAGTQRSKLPPRGAAALMLVIALMHHSWGLGVLVGLFQTPQPKPRAHGRK